MLRPELRVRFDAAVRRGLARAERDRAAELARIRPARRLTDEERKRIDGEIADPHAHRRAAAPEEDDP
jgi:hypothetical protein